MPCFSSHTRNAASRSPDRMKAWTESSDDLSVAIWRDFICLPRPTDFRGRDLRRGAMSAEKAVSDCNTSSRLLALRGIGRRCGNLSVWQRLFCNGFVTIAGDLARLRGRDYFFWRNTPDEIDGETGSMHLTDKSCLDRADLGMVRRK